MIVIVSVISLAESGWSGEGVTTQTVSLEGDLSIVQCSSLHLTSFAVLVDVRGVQVRTAPMVLCHVKPRFIYHAVMYIAS